MASQDVIPSLRLGVLVPSSNTAVEPVTISILSSLSPRVTVHFSRFTVTSISLSPEAISQFKTDTIIAAARLLADAGVDIIGWAGTSGGWFGFEADQKLCRAIEDAVGIPVTTSTWALNKAFEKMKCKIFGLVTPYLDDVQLRIVEVYTEAGYTVAAESHLVISDNHKIAAVGDDTLDRQINAVIQTSKEDGKTIEVITTFCTNLKAAHRVEHWEKEYGITVLDTVATVVWDMLKIKGIDTRNIKGWGRLFEL